MTATPRWNMPWGDSATNVFMQQIYMNDMGKLGPSAPGDTPTTLCQQERALPGSLHRVASFWGTTGPVRGDLGRNGLFLGLWCMDAVVCVRLHTLPPLPHSSSNLEGTVTSSPCYPSPTCIQGQGLEGSSHTALPGLLQLRLGFKPSPLDQAPQLSHHNQGLRIQAVFSN